MLLLALGNTLRRDDGVAARVVQLLPSCASRCVVQLTPELASDIATASSVVFVDADSTRGEVRLERISEGSEPRGLTHDLSPGALLRMARVLYGFAGEGWLCRIPVRDLSVGEGLSDEAEAAARSAADLLSRTFSL